jgi:hypothetical protein
MISGRVVLLLAAAAFALAEARAAPLDADTCAKLKGEHSQLELAGVEKDMEKGPEWAKANLAREKLDQIRRFIEVEEQLLFRCRDKSLVNLPPEQEQTPAADTDDQEKAKATPDDAPAKTPPGTTTKEKTLPGKTEPAKKTQPAKQQAKQGPAKAKPPARAAVKPPSDTDDPAPAAKAAPKVTVEEEQ